MGKLSTLPEGGRVLSDSGDGKTLVIGVAEVEGLLKSDRRVDLCSEARILFVRTFRGEDWDKGALMVCAADFGFCSDWPRILSRSSNSFVAILRGVDAGAGAT